MGLKRALRFILRRAAEILVFALLITFLPNLPPHVNIQKPYTLTPPKPFEGKLALNERLNNAERWHEGDLHGPEAFADFNGELYTSLSGGDIVKLTGEHITPVVKFGKPCKGLHQEKLCGRPLGMTFTKDGSLFVCDAYYGVFKVDIKTGSKVMLVSRDTEINGKKSKLPNAIAVASNGDFYWSDTSTQFELEDGVFDMLSDGSGRLIHYNARTKQNKVLLGDLLFANGVALSDDEDFVVVAESGRNRLHRCFLKGARQDKCEVFIDGLPGTPDNLKNDGRGGFLVSLIVPTDDDHPTLSQTLGPFPLIRRCLVRFFGIIQHTFKLVNKIYPNEYAEKAAHFVGHFESIRFAYSTHRYTLLQVSKSGEIIDSFHALDGKISVISEAHIFQDYVYFGSPFNDYIGRLPLSKTGLKEPAVKQAQAKPSTQVPTTQKPPVKTTQTPTTTTPPPSTVKQTQPPPTVKQTQPPPTVKQTQPPPSVKQTQPVTQKPVEKPTVAPEIVTTQKPVVEIKEAPAVKEARPPKAKEVPVQTKPAKDIPAPAPPPPQAKEVPVQAKPVKDIPSSPQVKEVPVQAKPVKDIPTSPPVKELPVQAKPTKDIPSSPQVKEVPLQTKPPPVKETEVPKSGKDAPPPSPTIEKKESVQVKQSAPPLPKQDAPKPTPDQPDIKKDSPKVAHVK